MGLPVRVVFDPISLDQGETVWVPQFEPTGEPVEDLADVFAGDDGEVERIRSVRPMVRVEKFEDRVAVSGIGRSRIGRKLMAPPLFLTVEAIRQAVDDAGLTMDDIDGLSTYPGTPAEGGYSEGGVSAVESVLGFRPIWHNGGQEVPGATGSLIAAMPRSPLGCAATSCASAPSGSRVSASWLVAARWPQPDHGGRRALMSTPPPTVRRPCMRWPWPPRSTWPGTAQPVRP